MTAPALLHPVADGDLAEIVETYGDDPQEVGAADGTEDDFGDLIVEFAHAIGLGDDASDEQQHRLDSAIYDSAATTMRDLAREVERAFGL